MVFAADIVPVVAVSVVMIVSVAVASVVAKMAVFVVVVVALAVQPAEPINFIKRWVMPHLGFKMCQTKLENFHQRSQKFKLWCQQILNIN